MLILPHIAFEGLDYDHACVNDDQFVEVTEGHINALVENAGDARLKLKQMLSAPVVDMEDVVKHINQYAVDANGLDLSDSTIAGEFGKAFTVTVQGQPSSTKRQIEFNPDNDVVLRRIYRGYSAGDPIGSNILTVNTGHLGEVDSPMYCNRVWGTAGGQIYKQRPTKSMPPN